MSLDLNKGTGVAYATGAAITTAAGFTSALFAAADLQSGVNEKWIVKVATTAGNIDLSGLAAPSTFAFLKDGDLVVFLKSTADVNKIGINDTAAAVTVPFAMGIGTNFNKFTNMPHSFVDGQGEYYTLVCDKSANLWGVNF